jgi:hypothetical protein
MKRILVPAYIVAVIVMIGYYSMGVNNITDLTFSVKMTEKNLTLIQDDYKSKTNGYKFVSDKMILEYSDLVRNDSLRNFLLSHRGLSENFHWYEIETESFMANVKLQIQVLTMRQNILLCLGLLSIATNLLLYFKSRRP